MRNIFKLNFHLFDGEGGGESAGTGNEGGYGAEASEFLASIGLKEEDIKPTEKPATKAKGKEEASQVGADKKAAEETPQQKFAKMIGKDGEFHDVYGEMVSKAVNERFKNQADLQGQVNQMNSAIAPLMQKYGLEAGDIEGLTQAIAEDDDLYRAGAEEKGLSLEQYKYNMRLEQDAARGRQIEEAYRQKQQQAQMFEGWKQQADEFKQTLPNFDLDAEIHTNPRFLALLSGGASVGEAFAATHASEIFNGYQKEVQAQAQADVISDIHRQAARPPEGALSHSPATQTRFDPSKLKGEDIDEILKRVENGEVLNFI